MLPRPWIPILAALLLAVAGGASGDAGYCGAGSFNCCPQKCCNPFSGLFHFKSRHCCDPCYQTCQDVVWEQQTYTCCKTVYDQVTTQTPVTCCKTVYDTCYRDECYT